MSDFEQVSFVSQVALWLSLGVKVLYSSKSGWYMITGVRRSLDGILEVRVSYGWVRLRSHFEVSANGCNVCLS